MRKGSRLTFKSLVAKFRVLMEVRDTVNLRRRVVLCKVLPKPGRPEPRTDPPAMFRATIYEADPNQVANDKRPQWWYGTVRRRKRHIHDVRKWRTFMRKETYHRIRKMKLVIMIMTDQLATANVCSLLFLGILAGTNLRASKTRPS
jgi:hypothetical protein